MNRFTFFTDIAGRLSQAVEGGPRVTAAAVVFPSAEVERIVTQLSVPLPKWRACTYDDASAAIDLLIAEGVSVGIFSVNKDTKAWKKFLVDSKPLHSAIVLQDRRPAGFVKPSNVLAFMLIGGACAIAAGHALKITPKNRITDYRGKALIERTVICDSDIGGEENLQVFRSFWERHDGSHPLIEKAGFRIVTRDVRVTTEQQEPLLLLADYAAGIAHAAWLTNPGRIRLPLSNEKAKELLAALNKSGKLAMETRDFDLTYQEVFGNVPELYSTGAPR